MADPKNGQKQHLFIQGRVQEAPFLPPGRGPKRPVVPERDREHHGGVLRKQVHDLHNEAEIARQAQEGVGLEDGFGIQIEFKSFPDIEFAFESLARESSGIELLNVRHDLKSTYATVFVPDGKLKHFENQIDQYLSRKTDKNGSPRDHQRLIDAIQKIRKASLFALWTDDPAVFPESENEVLWWEVWLWVNKERETTESNFRKTAQYLGIQVSSRTLEFQERIVLLIYTSAAKIRDSIHIINQVAELRRAKETADFFDSLPPHEQPEWVEDARERIQFSENRENTSFTCILDTGVNRGHPILHPALAQEDLYTVEPGWGVNDDDGHGTAMAGLALLGDWTPILANQSQEHVEHRLESVKLLPRDGQNRGGTNHHGSLTVQAVMRPEITAPSRLRVFGLMLTAKDNRDRGRPSSWSAALDKLAVDQSENGRNPRLFVVAAGNIREPEEWAKYPESNSRTEVYDPAQAWNALTVGAYTQLTCITETDAGGYTPIAPSGGLSPFSTTTATWEQTHWPLKPDVVFEGGNAATDSVGPSWMPSLCLLTAHSRPHERLFTTANATSAATALAAKMATQIRSAYPSFWPETVRALMVHSAEWTKAMRDFFIPEKNPKKQDYENLLKHCGFGVPNLDRALWSATDSLTLIAQESIQPFRLEAGSSQPKAGKINLHRLPWPKEELEALGATSVEMRVTLSYFIEPNPSSRGARSRYHYESHALRFDVKQSSETEDQFHARKNVEARDGNEKVGNASNDSNWFVGPNARHRGSLHGDIWRGPAVELASRDVLAVYPAKGWWKTRTTAQRYDQRARYALVISVRAPETEVDLYSPVAQQIEMDLTIST